MSGQNKSCRLSPELLSEFKKIVEEEYGIIAPDDELEEMAQNIIDFYSHAERLSNKYL